MAPTSVLGRWPVCTWLTALQIKLMSKRENVSCKVVGEANLYSPINHHLMNLLPLLTVPISPHLWVEALQRNSSNIHTAPHRNYEKQTDI